MDALIVERLVTATLARTLVPNMWPRGDGTHRRPYTLKLRSGSTKKCGPRVRRKTMPSF
jgi:hypothetical protein